jgi:uncharacterized protein Yka (UPF0111/DUF47 family)
MEQSRISLIMSSFLKHKQDVFNNLIARQDFLTIEGSVLLCKYMKVQGPEVAEQVSLKEKEADEVHRVLMDELNHAFNAPFAREDIFNLSRTFDDGLDYAYNKVDEIDVPNKAANSIADIVVKRT